MNGKENIISKILADADNKCAEILASAELQAQETNNLAKAFADAERQSFVRRLDTLSAERERNCLANADLEARKYKLQEKQRLISACYEKALTALCKASDKNKLDFIGKILKTYAEKGETVIVAKADKNLVTQKFLDGFGLGLVLGKTYADAVGGVVLQGATYDKDLTLEKLVAYSREQTESRVAAALFGDNDE
ncbi:MAG: hypothetical protein NC132_01770 [Corallococcus sp.]|nr:hypothetical protein [Corallococcus sp.]MCM1359386.1 hypothetical protein [Corallococcus sp.]MCM1394829.1 hypothetical protein [Corallococcus sp.]